MEFFVSLVWNILFVFLVAIPLFVLIGGPYVVMMRILRWRRGKDGESPRLSPAEAELHGAFLNSLASVLLLLILVGSIRLYFLASTDTSDFGLVPGPVATGAFGLTVLGLAVVLVPWLVGLDHILRLIRYHVVFRTRRKGIISYLLELVVPVWILHRVFLILVT